MDSQGERAKALARAVTAAGVRRCYIVDGGFRAWAAELAVNARSSEYEAGPLALVGDVAESGEMRGWWIP